MPNFSPYGKFGKIQVVSNNSKKILTKIVNSAEKLNSNLIASSSTSNFSWKTKLEIAEQLQALASQLKESPAFSSNPHPILTFSTDWTEHPSITLRFEAIPKANKVDWHQNETFIDLDTSDVNDLTNLETILSIENAQKTGKKRDVSSSLAKLKTLSETEKKLFQPTFLDLSDTSLNNIPDIVMSLTSLTKLDVSNNSIGTIPSQIGQLVNLVSLNLADNFITDLPEDLFSLAKLEHLNLKARLSAKPSASSYYSNEYFKKFCRLENLTELNLSGWGLEKIPPEIKRLKKLRALDLSKNKLTSLPPEILDLKSLEILDLRDNSLNFPPEILAQTNNAQAILNYMAWILDGKRQPLSEIKMLIVGQGSVGKTSIVKRLTGTAFSEKETKTDGIAIKRWQIPNTKTGDNQPKTLRVNIWDFGGQEIMHATHQFFLTRRSLYLLVLDARLTQEENRVEYWLKIIQSFGGDSPVLLVGNKTDQHPLDIDHSGLQKKYSSIVGVLEISAATGAGLEKLKAAITEQVNNLPHVRDALPEAWFKVKNQLEELGRVQNYISQEKYIETCAAGEISDETSQHTLIGFLHDLGIVLHFQDDPRLAALGILNPQWVTNGVYKILNAHSLFQNKGVLERAMLDEILGFPEYPANKRIFIIDMMREFELCYDLEPDKTFLVPDLLPKDEPYAGEWQGALAFQYHYNVLPSSIVSRFIVRMNAYIHKTVWRSGVVLKKGENTALVKADTEDRKIYIWVNGAENTRRDFLSAIRAEFDAIHKTIIKIESTEKVPVPGNEKVVIDFQHLLKLERMGETTFIPEGLDQRVNVRELLNGVRIGSDVPRSPVPQPVPVESPVPEKSAPPPDPVKPAQAAAGSESLPWRVIRFIFVTIPRAIGHIPLDLTGKGKDAQPSTPLLLGYAIIIAALLVLLGIIGTDVLVAWFAGWWRFFNPVK